MLHRYLAGTTDEWELLDVVAWKPGRVVFYPTNLLHTSHIDEQAASSLSCDPSRGRLVVSSFWRWGE
jgi:hypothetical protein